MKLETIRRLERSALRKGLYLIDAPVCRAEEGAIAGNLLMLGSGDRRAFARLRPVLRTFCTDIFHLGKVGAGQVAKICNNILLWISVVANCETFGLAERCGLDKAALVEALRLSTGTNGTIHRSEQGSRAFDLMIEGGKRLAAEKVDVLICGGAAVAVMKGVDGDAEMEQALRRETGLPLVMANGGILAALRFLGARSVIAISPFIEALESETGKPVISAPAAWIWGALKALDIRECTPGYGRLLDSLRAA